MSASDTVGCPGHNGRRKHRARAALRVALMIGFALAATGRLPWPSAPRWLPALSPFAALSGAIADHRATVWLLAVLPLLLLSVWKGAWFCARLCPAGFLAQIGEKIRPAAFDRTRRMPHLGRAFLLLGLGGALLGYPLWIWMDPFTLFNGCFAPLGPHAPHGIRALAAGFALLLAASLLFPGLWCRRLCPLGALFDLTFRFRMHARHRLHAPPVPGRRLALGLLAGGAAAVTLRRIGSGGTPRVRPPGACAEDRIGGLCARCGNCFQACPQQIIQPDLGESGVANFLTPRLSFATAYCDEWCDSCGAVCPTGALENLGVDAKRGRKLGTAEVDRTRCIAWAEGAYCMVCQEFCPYLAITPTDHNGVACPTVSEDKCRGCGACESQCPARPSRAIVVRPMSPQGRHLKDEG